MKDKKKIDILLKVTEKYLLKILRCKVNRRVNDNEHNELFKRTFSVCERNSLRKFCGSFLVVINNNNNDDNNNNNNAKF